MSLLTEAIIMENQRKQEAIEIQNMKISTANVLPELNNECLLYIFSFLPIMDRIRIQRVCKRWQEIGNLPWQDMKRLNFYKSTWTTHSRQFRLSEKIVHQVFQLCGGFLREIHICLGLDVKFGAITKKLEGVFVDLLRESCPNVQILYLEDVRSECKILEDFANYFNRITHLTIDSDYSLVSDNSPDSCYQDDDILAHFFRRNGNLRSLTLYGVNLQGRCFRFLPFQIIEELIIDESFIEKIELDSISKLQLSNLKTFTFTNTYCENSDEIFELITGQSNLRQLEIISTPEDNIIFKGTTKLHHLDTMKLSRGILSDDLLMSASKNYKNLTRVELCNSNDVTDSSLIQVLCLPNLQYVQLIRMPRITDKVLLTRMLKLKSLECAVFPLLENDGFRAVMESSKNLENLWVYKYEKVSTAKLITDAIQITKNRKSNLKLKLRVLVNEVCKVINDSPLLQIVEM